MYKDNTALDQFQIVMWIEPTNSIDACKERSDFFPGGMISQQTRMLPVLEDFVILYWMLIALFKLFATIIDNHPQFRRRAWNPVSSLGTHAFAFQETVVEQFVEELSQISMAA